MTESTLKNRGMFYNKKVMGFVILILFMIINPGCMKESITTTTPPKETTQLANNASMATFHIGQSYGGGIIFYIDGSGQHGLIADINDTNYKMLKGGAVPLKGAYKNEKRYETIPIIKIENEINKSKRIKNHPIKNISKKIGLLEKPIIIDAWIIIINACKHNLYIIPANFRS